jgi:hypothetical protein
MTSPSREVRTLDDADAHVRSLWTNVDGLAARVRYLEELIDTKDSPWWKRVWFRLDGYPAWYRVGPRSKRPWH